jgi:hypothetical protein
MPALDNAKHERFAQEIAKGASNREAYRSAGYETKSEAATDANASRLLSDDKVRSRIAEIQERAATRAEITVASITENLARIARKAEDMDGPPGLAVARAAQMDIAKLNGLVVDKKVVAETTLEDLLDSLAAGEAATASH